MDPCRGLGPPVLECCSFIWNYPCGWCSITPKEKRETHQIQLPVQRHPPAQSTERGDIKQVSWLYDDEAI